jgi:hypothetical protein
VSSGPARLKLRRIGDPLEPVDDARQALGAISFRGVQADAYFSVRVLLQLDGLGEAGAHIAHIMTPWWAMYVHEGREILREHLPELYTPMSDEASETFEHSRHGLKMFLDTKRDIAAYEKYFVEIGQAHRDRFVNRVHPTSRGLAHDLGVTTYQGKVVSTTHGVAFAMGLEPAAIQDEGMGPRLGRLWREAGRSFAMAACATGGPPPAIVGLWRADQFVVRDVDAEDYYSSVFTGSEHPHLNAVLLHYLGMVNSVDLLFPLVSDLESDEYSLFKIRYLATAHVLGSLKKLARDDRTLPAASREHLRRLLEEVPSPVSTDRSWLRNLLVHYEPDGKADLSRFDRERLLNGIVSVAEVPEGIEGVIEQTQSNLSHLADCLNDWMAPPDRAPAGTSVVVTEVA